MLFNFDFVLFDYDFVWFDGRFVLAWLGVGGGNGFYRQISGGFGWCKVCVKHFGGFYIEGLCDEDNGADGGVCFSGFDACDL